jgi:hypothetical protein
LVVRLSISSSPVVVVEALAALEVEERAVIARP